MKVDNSGNNLYYYPYGNCYLSGSYLKTYCNSGGSTGGGSTGGGSTGGGSTEEDCPTKCSRANYPYTKPYNGTCYCCINADDVPLEQGRFNSNCIQP